MDLYKYAKSGYSLADKTSEAFLRENAQLHKETETLKNICQEYSTIPVEKLITPHMMREIRNE